MLSTIRRPRRRDPNRGQVIVLFAGSLAVLLIIAALAFDVGTVLVERRDQQDAADAAALAGARYVLTSGTFNGLCPDSGVTGNQAVDAACSLAHVNGFDHATDANENVHVYIPAIHGRYAHLPGFIEVQIDATRPSIFGGIIGRVTWPVGAFGVATSGQNLSFSFGMLALDPTACKAIQVSGTGVVNSFGSIQSNSNGSGCASGGNIGFSRTGGSTINVIGDGATCRSVGDIQDQGSGSWVGCSKVANSFALPDPLRFLPAPPKPALAAAMVEVPGQSPKAAPNYCPGAGAPKQPSESPLQTAGCDVGGNGSSYANLAWILYPGLYPRGIQVTNGATAYLMPGIYWLGGGGLSVKNGGSIVTIATEADAAINPSAATWGGGVLLYNSQLDQPPGGTVESPGGPIVLDGSGATMKLQPFEVTDSIPDSCADYSCYNDIVIFQDRAVTSTVTLNGSSSTTSVEGMIYVPAGQVQLNGNGGTLDVDQIIADTYLINGNGGTINVNKNTDFESTIVAAGLVD